MGFNFLIEFRLAKSQLSKNSIHTEYNPIYWVKYMGFNFFLYIFWFKWISLIANWIYNSIIWLELFCLNSSSTPTLKVYVACDFFLNVAVYIKNLYCVKLHHAAGRLKSLQHDKIHISVSGRIDF